MKIKNNPNSIYRNRDIECQCEGEYHDEGCPLAKAIKEFLDWQKGGT